MRSVFPGHFRPTSDEFASLWSDCIFVIDANVLLNLYRYSSDTRQELERALTSIKDRSFLPHQAAKEFLKNRLGVTAGQAEEYTKAIKTISDLSATLSNKKKHPFLPEGELPNFTGQVEKLLVQLETQKEALFSRLNNDEILEFVDSLFSGRTGAPFDESQLKALATEGETRYQHDIPPGYKDGKKDASGDPYRKFGDLIVWKQIIAKAKDAAKPVIFITDDKKEDWWLEQSNRTIGPRTELREEFIREVSNDFWMYSVDRFIEEAARISNTIVSKEVIEEIIEVREDAMTAQSEAAIGALSSYDKIIHPVLSEEELFNEIVEFLDSHPSEDGSIGLRYFVVNYLGSQNYEVNHSYARINALAGKGRVEIFKRERNGAVSTRLRLPKNG